MIPLYLPHRLGSSLNSIPCQYLTMSAGNSYNFGLHHSAATTLSSLYQQQQAQQQRQTQQSYPNHASQNGGQSFYVPWQLQENLQRKPSLQQPLYQPQSQWSNNNIASRNFSTAQINNSRGNVFSTTGTDRRWLYNNTPRQSTFHQEVLGQLSESPSYSGFMRKQGAEVDLSNQQANPRYGRKRTSDNPDISPTKRLKQSNSEQASALLSRISELSSLPKPTPVDHSSSMIWSNFMKTQQTESIFQNKMKLREALYSIVKGVFPYCGLYMVGSSMNGFGSTTSDLDLCLMVTHKKLDQKKEATEVLFLLQKALRKCSFIREMQLIRAKVPILKFRDKIAKVECDLNINNSVGIRNTYLMASYSRLDPRVRPLVMYVKKWARYHDINDARKMTLSSYSLTLMIIHYLQYSCKPAILPCLHTLAPDQFNVNRDVRMMSLGDTLPDFDPRNTEAIADVFLGFLEYYATKFDFKEDVISVRLGKKVPKQVVMQNEYSQQWGYISIEEPFDLSNTARSVYDECAFMKICRVFQSSYRRLKNTRDLSSLFLQPF